MKKKLYKAISLVLILASVCALLAGCGSDSGKITQIVSYPDDGDYLAVANDALEQYCQEKGIECTIVEGHKHTGHWDSIKDNQLVIVRSFYEEICLEMAKENPKIKFIAIGPCHAADPNGQKKCPNSNVLHFDYDSTQKGFISGYLAAKASKTGEIALVIPDYYLSEKNNMLMGTEIASVILGAKQADPDIKVHMALRTTSSEVIFDTRADVIVTGRTTYVCDVLNSMNLDRHVWVVGYTEKESIDDRYKQAVDKYLLTTVYEQYDIVLPQVIENTINGTQQYGITVKAAVESGVVGFDKTSNYDTHMTDDVKQAMDILVKNISEYDVPAENSYTLEDAFKLVNAEHLIQ